MSRWNVSQNSNINCHKQYTRFAWTVRNPWFVVALMHPDFQIWGRWSVISLAPERFEWNFRYVIFKPTSFVDVLRNCPEMHVTELYWWQISMAWCHQTATSHCLNKCWPSSPMPYDVTRLHWIKQGKYGYHPQNGWPVFRKNISKHENMQGTYIWWQCGNASQFVC